MKSVSKIIILALLSSCSKEDLPHLQSHDENRMMTIMHHMMSNMDTVPKTKDPEIDFLRMMRVHHQGAIEMANLELSEGGNDSLKRTAQKIINEQQAEIVQFTNYLNTHSPDNSSEMFAAEHEQNMMKMSKVADVQFITGDVDNDMAALMIPHHQGAIENATTYLKYGNDPMITVWAQKIIATQKTEIIEMSNWLIANRR